MESIRENGEIIDSVSPVRTQRTTSSSWGALCSSTGQRDSPAAASTASAWPSEAAVTALRSWWAGHLSAGSTYRECWNREGHKMK